MSIYEIVFLITLPLQTIAVFLYNKVFFTQRVTSKITETLSYLFYTAMIAGVFLTVRMPFGFITANLLGIFLVALNYESKMMKKIMNVFIIYFIMFVAETVVWIGIGFFEIGMFEYSQFDSVLGVLITRVVLVSVAYVFYKYANNKKSTINLPWYYYMAHIVVIFGVLWLFLLSIEYETMSTGQMIFCCVLFITVIAAILFIDNMVYYTFAEKHKLEIIKMQNEAYENQTEIINQSVSSIRAIKHDINNHIYSIISMYENNSAENAREYAQKVIDEINGNNNISKSGNFIIDSIVNFKLQQLVSSDVELNVKINVPPSMHIIAYDLTVILGNLLDNAIKAVMETKTDKKLSLDISVSKGNLIILVDNSYSGKLIINDGQMQSTKESKHKHGMGINNIEKTVQKYGGELYIDYTEKLFSASTIIPYKE